MIYVTPVTYNNSYMKSRRYLLAFGFLLILASCTEVGVGGTVNGGSNGNVSVGAGVNIHLYNGQDK